MQASSMKLSGYITDNDREFMGIFKNKTGSTHNQTNGNCGIDS